MTTLIASGFSASGWRARLRRFFIGRSLAMCVDQGGRDNILHLRLGAALMVLLGHSYAVFGRGMSRYEPMHFLFPGTLTHITGVMLFFVISGFLITLSWQRRPELARFLLARVLRIWPALAVCVVLTACVLGALATVLPLKAYFLDGDRQGTVATYVLHNLVLAVSYTLPGVFDNNPVPHYVNASLWTLPVETTLYVCVAALGLLRCLRYPLLTSIGIAIVFSALILRPMYLGLALPWYGYVLAGFFGAGSIACLLRKHVPVSSGIMLLILCACIGSRFTTHVIPFTWLAIGYFVIWFCYVPRLPPIIRNLDVSYGTYLWSYPVQQCLVQAGIHEPLLLFAVATPIALALGTGSWLLIEKPALRLKDTALLSRRASPTPDPRRVAAHNSGSGRVSA